ncbi:MAG: DUF1292 domain-containing protein [Lachnospiraceae bacterium]|nr:DUF1292 domain-containing protein [Lachnospiraceae bacterium]
MEKIILNTDGDSPLEYYVLEQTRIGGVDYLLLSDVADGDGEALILKDISGDGEEEGMFVTITDENELSAVAEVFENMLEDVTIEN